MIIDIPYIDSFFSKETTELFKNKLKIICNSDNVDNLGPPSLDLTNLKIKDYKSFGVNHGKEIQCNVEIQCFDYWQKTKNFEFKKYPIYGGYLLPKIFELENINEFKIYKQTFRVIKNKKDFFNSRNKWISIYSLFFLDPNEIKELLKHGVTKIFFTEESYDRCFLSFIEVFIELGITREHIKSNIIFVGGTINQNNKKIFNKYISCPITMIHPTYFSDYYFNNTTTSINVEKPKDILYLVRKPRNHRIIAFLLLNYMSDIDNHIITHPLLLNKDELNYKNLYNGKHQKKKQNILKYLENNLPGKIVERYKNISNIEIALPLTAEYSDVDEINTISWTTMIEPNINNFIYSKISLVAETYGFNNELNNENTEYNQVFLTEKTGRCLYYGHPFILISTMESLKVLNNYGFNTYSDYINTDYDTINDDFVRFESAVKSAITFVENWNNINKSKLYEIVNYNRNNFINSFIPEIFKNICS